MCFMGEKKFFLGEYRCDAHFFGVIVRSKSVICVKGNAKIIIIIIMLSSSIPVYMYIL